MTATVARRSDVAPVLFGVLLVGEAVACLIFSAAHLGRPLPLGFVTLNEPRVLPATVVEALCGVVLAVAGGALLARRAWALGAALAAQFFSLGGFVLGVVSTLRGGGAGDPVNDDFHRVMLALFVLGLAATVLMRRGRHAGASPPRGRPAA